MSDAFSVEALQEVVSKARAMPYPIRPLMLDDGRQMYIALSSRETMIHWLRPGWTLELVPCAAAHNILLYEPVPIDDTLRPSTVVHGEWGYI